MSRIVDLTLPIKPHWRWFAQSMRITDHAKGDSFTQTFMVLDMHGFTHVDAPKHYLADGATMEKMPLERWCGEATVVDLTHIGANYLVTPEDLEAKAQHVREGDIVLLRSDWPLKCDWQSMDFWGDGPSVSGAACEWLIERKVKTVGYDFMPDDILRYQVLEPKRKQYGPGWEHITHEKLFPAGITVVEYLQNLHLITQQRFQFFALPLPIVGSDGSPVRAIAILDD